MTRTRADSGVTLVELIIVLAILGIAGAVAGLSMRAAGRVRTPDSATVALQNAREAAVRSGHSVTIATRHGDRFIVATATPDGHVVADSSAVQVTPSDSTNAMGRAHP